MQSVPGGTHWGGGVKISARELLLAHWFFVPDVAHALGLGGC
jgi:hypothetical protein